MEDNESLLAHIFSFNSFNSTPLKVLFFKLKLYEKSKNSHEIEVQLFNKYLHDPYFSRILDTISRTDPDIVIYQGAYEGHEMILCINSYECIFYSPQKKNTGFAFLWKTEKLLLITCIKIDYFLKDVIKKEEYSGGIISVFSTINGEKYCLVNTEFNNSSFSYEYQAYVLSNQLFRFNTNINRTIIIGNLCNSEHILCSPKIKISFEAFNCIKSIYFKRTNDLVEIYRKPEEKTKIDGVFNFLSKSKSNIDIFYKGPVLITEMKSEQENSLYFEFK